MAGGARPRGRFTGGDRFVLTVALGFAATAALDRLLLGAGATDPRAWFATAAAPLSIGWAIAGARTGGRGWPAALVSTGLYVTVVTAMEILSGVAEGRAELPAAMLLAAFAAHAGAVFRESRQKIHAKQAVSSALTSDEPTGWVPSRHDLELAGISDEALTEAGMVSALLRIQAARERRGWVSAFVAACALALFGATSGRTFAAWGGAGMVAAVVGAAVARALGAGRARDPYELLVAGHFESAMLEFRRSLARVPTDVLGHLGLAMSELRMGEHETAAAEFLTAQVAGYGEIPSYLLAGTERHLGLALRRAGAPRQLEQARVSLQRVLSVFPEHPDALLDMGLALGALGEKRGAERVLRRALARGCREAQAALAALESVDDPSAGAGQGADD